MEFLSAGSDPVDLDVLAVGSPSLVAGNGTLHDRSQRLKPSKKLVSFHGRSIPVPDSPEETGGPHTVK